MNQPLKKQDVYFHGKRARGRPPGSLNKMTISAKAAIDEAAQKLGGVNRLVEWAKEDPLNERAFWSTIYPKLIPLTSPEGNADQLPIAIQINIVNPQR